MLASKFPGFYYSSHYFLNYLSNDVIISENQFRFIIKELTGKTLDVFPKKELNIKLVEE